MGFDNPQSTEAGYIVGFYLMVWRGQSWRSDKGTNGLKSHVGGGDRLWADYSYNKQETRIRSDEAEMVPVQLTKCYFWHRKADCLGVAGDRQRNHLQFYSVSKWVRRSSLMATLTKLCHLSSADSVLRLLVRGRRRQTMEGG